MKIPENTFFKYAQFYKLLFNASSYSHLHARDLKTYRYTSVFNFVQIKKFENVIYWKILRIKFLKNTLKYWVTHIIFTKWEKTLKNHDKNRIVSQISKQINIFIKEKK